jgi:uncharacterized protein YndB with AHSA1/START domain
LRLLVEVVVPASPAEVWRYVRDIEAHVEWMEDARSITFTSDTTFDCDTVIGPFQLVDRMEIVAWEEERLIGIRHGGLVRGEGRFTLAPEDGGRRTRFTWAEYLWFPWWLGGPAAAALAKPVLLRAWRRNLANLRARFAS